MSGELNTREAEPETIYDSGYRGNLSSARDVLAFVLTPPDVFEAIDEEDRQAAAILLAEAKREAVAEWLRLRKKH